jgi:hypothetical protein
MTASVTITLDTKPPASPTLLINAGSTVTGHRVVQIDASTADYEGGARDVRQMKVWGDVEPDDVFGLRETDSLWLPYTPTLNLRLTDGNGLKTLFARLMDDVCNTTPIFTDSITLDLSSPLIQVVTAIDRARISKVAPCAQATFAWQANVAHDRYQVRVVPTIGSSHQAGVLLGTYYGSINTTGVGSFPADTPTTVVVAGADLEAASPGDTRKVLKVFVRGLDGKWSP